MRHASDARGHAHRAAGIHQNDGKSGAGGFALLDGFRRALIVALAGEVVMDVDLLEKFAVQGLRRLGGVGAIVHDFAGASL